MHLNEILEKYDGKFAHYSNEGPESLWYKFKQSLQNKKFDLSIGRQVLRAVMAKQVKHTKGAILLSMHFTVCIKSATEA